MTDRTLRPLRLSRQSLSRHLTGFLRSLRGKRPETRGTYERALREFARWFSRDRRCRFRVKDIERYKDYLAGSRKLSEVSVSTYLTALRRFCRYLVGVRLLKQNPASLVSGNSRPRRHSRQGLSPDDVVRLLNVPLLDDERGLRDRAVVELMLYCGLSEIEIIRANVADLHAVEGHSSLAVQGKGRTRKDASVDIPPRVAETIEQYLAVRPRRSPVDPLFLSAGNSSRGRRLTTRSLRDRVNHHLERAGLRTDSSKLRVTPYSLRHTTGLLLASSGASADEIRKRMRLGTLETAQLYLDKDH